MHSVPQPKDIPITTVTQIVTSSPNRKAITFYPPGQQVQIGIGNIVPGLSSGMTIGPNTPPLRFTREIHGDVVTQSFTAYAPFAACQLVFEETMGPQ